MASQDPHINPQTGVWDDNYYARTQSQNNQNTSTSSFDPSSAIKLATEQYKQAAAPAISSLQQQQTETTQKYSQERQRLQAQQPSLEARYNNLLDSIKSNQTTAENRVITDTNNELGKRGITGDSTLAGQTITNAVNPVTAQYTTMAKDTGLAKEDAIKALQDQISGLSSNEISDQRAIANAIAQLQGNAGSSGISTGLNLYSQNLDNEFKQQQLDQQAKQQQAQQALAELVQQQNNQTQLAQLGISQQNANTSAGNLGLSRDQFNYQKSLNDPATIQKLFNSLGIGVGNNGQTNMSINPAAFQY